MGQQPGRHDPGVVDHQQVTGTQFLGQIGDPAVPGPKTVATLEDEHSCRVTRGGRLLRNLLRGEVIVEVGHAHGIHFPGPPGSWR